VIADAGGDPDETEADGRRSEIDDRHQVRRQTTSADGLFFREMVTPLRLVDTRGPAYWTLVQRPGTASRTLGASPVIYRCTLPFIDDISVFTLDYLSDSK
jgi:hypothetical protein